MSALGFPSKENQNKMEAKVNLKNKYTIKTFQKSILFGSLSKIVSAKRNEGNDCLSIQEQVLLNIVYPPAIRSKYNPQVGNTGLFYCEKSFTAKINHQYLSKI